MNRLRKLADCGQSYWMDDLSRDLLRSGDLPLCRLNRLAFRKHRITLGRRAFLP